MQRNSGNPFTRPETCAPGGFLLSTGLHRRGAFWLVAAVLLCDCKGFATELAPREGVVFASAVSSNYGSGKSLRGWESTSLAVQATLAEWHQTPRMKPTLTARDPSPEGLKQFLRELPGADSGKIEIIYLAAQHTPAGAWQFTGRGVGAHAWNDLLQNAPPPHPCRLVILDVCHAAAVTQLPAWTEKMDASATLLASARDEVTWELDFTKRQPVDLPARFPATTAWLKQHLPTTWDGRLSYLGVIWVQAYLQTPQPPRTRREWQSFFGRCETESRKFQQQVGRKRASTMGQFPAAPWPGSPCPKTSLKRNLK